MPRKKDIKFELLNIDPLEGDVYQVSYKANGKEMEITVSESGLKVAYPKKKDLADLYGFLLDSIRELKLKKEESRNESEINLGEGAAESKD